MTQQKKRRLPSEPVTALPKKRQKREAASTSADELLASMDASLRTNMVASGQMQAPASGEEKYCTECGKTGCPIGPQGWRRMSQW